MAKLLKLRRGTTTQHGSFTGAEGEVTVDTDKETLVVHDGSTAGGHPVAAEDLANVSSSTIAGRLSNDSIAPSKIGAGALPTDVTIVSANISNGTIINADVNASAGIAGTKISPDFGTQNVTTTGTASFGNNIELTGTSPFINLVDSNNNSDYKVENDDGALKFKDMSNSNATRVTLQADGTLDVFGNLDANSGLDVTGNITVSGTVDGADVAAMNTKLTGIESGATADQTKSDIDALNINADTVDSLHASSFVRSDANDVLTGSYDFQHTGNYPVVIGNSSGMADAKMVLRGSANPYIRFREQNTDKAYIQWNSGGYLEIYNEEHARSLKIKNGESGLIWNVGGTERTVWHSGNDGSGSGLDADTLDGVEGSNYLRSDVQDTKSGSLNINGGTSHGANDATLYVDADNNNDWGIICNKLNNGSTEYGIESRVHSGSSFALSVLGSGSRVFRVGGNGDIVNSGSITASGNVTAYSDAKLKTDISTINDALSICGKLRGVSYKWIADGKPSIGVIAQEVEEVLPEVVLTNKEVNAITQEIEEVKSVDYGKIVGVLINAINELKAEVDELKGGK